MSWLKRDAKMPDRELTIAFDWNDRLIKNAFEEEFDKIVDKKKHKKAPKLNPVSWPSRYTEDRSCGGGGCGYSSCISSGCGAGGC